MARIKKNNKDVFQSYILTVAKYDFSTYEKRILYRLVEMAQKDVPQPFCVITCVRLSHPTVALT